MKKKSFSFGKKEFGSNTNTFGRYRNPYRILVSHYLKCQNKLWTNQKPDVHLFGNGKFAQSLSDFNLPLPQKGIKKLQNSLWVGTVEEGRDTDPNKFSLLDSFDLESLIRSDQDPQSPWNFLGTAGPEWACKCLLASAQRGCCNDSKLNWTNDPSGNWRSLKVYSYMT